MVSAWLLFPAAMAGAIFGYITAALMVASDEERNSRWKK